MGYGGDAAVWIENFTSGQSWRLERMATWPDHFGEEGHKLAVSFGAQCKMAGVNMLTAVVMAMTPDLERQVFVHQPHRGRASRITRCGDFTYVIGVRGRSNPFTDEEAAEEVPEQFSTELLLHPMSGCARTWRRAAGSLDDLVRTDCALKRIGDVGPYYEQLKERFGGSVPFVAYSVGTLLGGRAASWRSAASPSTPAG